MIWPQLIMWVVSFLLTDYFRERLPSQTPSGIGDFNIPTATEGRPVPIITGGTVRCDAPNCIWYGDFVAVDRTTTTGIVFKREEVIGYTYELSMQYALFKGESVGISAIYIGDEKVFDMVDDAGGIPQEFVDVDKEDLFGGKDQGGGFQGRVRLHKGTETQPVSAFLDSRISPLPAYRGLSYIVITNLETQVLNGWLIETIPGETKGANFGEANQIRYVRVEVQTFDDLAGTAGSPGLGDTLNLANDHHFIGPDINPIIVAWDLWTNTRWGRGFGLADVDINNFRAAAEICWAEGLGWTNLIDEQTTTGKIQDTIEQHIDGYIGPNPLTGLIEVNLARPDYVLLSLPLVDDSNLIEVKEWSQGDWSNTKNRIRIRYTSRSKSWKETHAVETAAGNRIIVGKTVTEEIRYEGCHTDAVAAIIAARDKRGLSIPLQKGTIIVDRTGYLFKPGQPFRLTSDQTKTTDLAVRVTRVAYGDIQKQQIELSVVEDIFGNEPATVAENPPSDFVPPIQAVIPFDALSQAALEPSFHLMQYDTLPGVTGRIATMARRNLGNRPTEYATLQRNSAGVPAGAYTSLTPNITAGFSAVGTLRNAELAGQAGNGTLTIQVDPFLQESLDALIGTYDPRFNDPRGIAIISPGLADEEFIVFRDVIDDGTGIQLTGVYRSASDTTWKAHAAGAGVWFIWTGGFGMNETQTYALARNVEIKLLPVSPNSQVLEAAATALPIVTMDTGTGDRTTKPLVPVELEIPDGSPWPTSVNMDATIVPQSGPNYTGTQVVPLHRLAGNPDIQDSVQGFTLAGIPALAADFADQNLDVSFWIYDVDQSVARANALWSSLNVAVVEPDQEIQVEKADLVAGGATGFSFNARVEIETRDSRPSSPALNVSHEPVFHDFVATGVFSVNPEDVLFLSHFDGADAATAADDRSAQNQFIEFEGNAQIDTAEFFDGDSSLLLDGVDSYVRVPMDKRFNVDQNYTLEMRVRFAADPAGNVCLAGQFDGQAQNSWAIYYSGSTDQWAMVHSTNGSNENFDSIISTTWVPTPGVWYAVAFCHQDIDLWHVFVDGTRVGTAVTNSENAFNSSGDLLIGARRPFGTALDFFDGHIDEVRLTNRVLYLDDYTPGHPDFPLQDFDDMGQSTPFLCHFEGTLNDTTVQSDDLNNWEINMGGTSIIDTSQFVFGSSSMRCFGFDSTTPKLSDGAWIEDTIASAAAGGGRRRTAFDLKRKDWTMDMRVRFATLPDNEGSALFGKYARGLSAGLDWYWSIESNLTMVFNMSINGAISSQHALASPVLTIVIDTWYLFSLERIGDDLFFYQDGVLVHTGVDFFLAASGFDYVLNDDGPNAGGTFKNNPVSIGQMYSPNTATRHRAMDGWIDEARISFDDPHGGATFTVPVVPFADPNRVVSSQSDRDPLMLLDHFDGTDFFATDWVRQDESRIGARLGFAGSGRLLDGFVKFGTTSFNFSGSADYGIYMSSIVNHWLADDDFTADMWIRHDNFPHLETNGGHSIVGQWQAASNRRAWFLYLDDAGADTDLVFAWSVDGTVVKTAFVAGVVGSGAVDDDVWVHYQVTRDGSTIRLWIDGNEQTLDGASDSIGADVIFDSKEPIKIGYMTGEPTNVRDMDGYGDELRIIRTATPAGNFTPPTAAYPNPLPVNEDPFY